MGAWVLALTVVLSATDPDGTLARAGIEITEVDAVEPVEAAVLVDELAGAIEAAARAHALVVGIPAAPCPIGSPRCVRVIPDLVEARVTVRIFGGLSMVRVDATATGNGIPTTRSSADLSRDPELARAGLTELARALFPSRLTALAPVTPRPPAPESETIVELAPPAPVAEQRDVTWLVVGGGAAIVFGALGLAFGVSSAAARDGAETPGVDSATFDTLADRAQAHGWAANVFFVTAALGLAAGAIVYVVEP